MPFIRTKRHFLLALSGTALDIAWKIPVAGAMLLSDNRIARASLEIAPKGTIIARSLVANNADGAGRRLAILTSTNLEITSSCCSGDLVVEASGLNAGTYKIAACNSNSLIHTVKVTTETGTTVITHAASTGCPGTVMAYVTIPGGARFVANGSEVVKF